MKNLLFLICIITFWACSSVSEGEPEPEPEPIPEEPKEYIVSLGLTGEIDIEESPLSKASGNDLYGIQVYSKTSTNEYTPYAYGLFDDKSKMTIKLLEGYSYKFQVTMVVDGKNKIYYYNGGYYEPFILLGVNKSLELTNLLSLDNKIYLSYIDKGSTWVVAGTSNFESCEVAPIERYYGEIENYNPTENGSISINMKRVSFGIKFIAEGLTEGKLKINIKEAPELNIPYGQTEIQDIFTFKNTYPNGLTWTKDDYSETIPVSISWEKVDGAVVPLINKDITFKRNVLTTITIKVKDTSMNNNIDISQESGEMTQGENITIESGSGLDGNVKPVENQ
nr:MAG TPA: hypothetical protein [Caudoviricetes sp.]